MYTLTLKDTILGHIKRCFSPKSLESVYASMIKTNTTQDCFLVNQFISACSNLSCINLAASAVANVQNPNVLVFNALIRGCVHCCYSEQALVHYMHMLRNNVMPTSYSFSSLIKACTLLVDSAFGEAVHGHVWKHGFDSHVFVQTTLIEFYSTFGMIPDEVTMTTVISACAHLGALALGKEVHLYLVLQGFDLDVYIGSSLIDMYAKCGSIDRALLVFYKLQTKNLFCWNCIIDGLATHGYVEEALRMFGEMERKRIRPNAVTFISILTACTHAGFIEEGRRWFMSMVQDYCIAPQVEHYGCMVDLLSKAGLLEDALEMIRNMTVEPNSFIWGALLNGCKLHKNLEIAHIAVQNLMVLEPSNSGHYSLLVNMYAEENRWNEVAKIRTTMKDLGVEKRCPGSSWVEINKTVHLFAASDTYHPSYSQLHLLLAELDDQLRLAGYVPELGSIL
ncbi:hypothetical protein JHK87_023367 [Glycine soja]|nr:hypothetical protein JHK87_023367 [Glycine soja]